MTSSPLKYAKLAALGLLAAVMCTAQIATAWQAPLNNGEFAEGLEVGLAHVIEWERSSPGSVFSPDNKDDVSAITETGLLAAASNPRHVPLPTAIVHRGDKLQTALPAIRAPPLYATSA